MVQSQVIRAGGHVQVRTVSRPLTPFQALQAIVVFRGGSLETAPGD